MRTAAADYSIRVIEFARATSPLGLLLHGQAGEREIPYCFTVLRSAEHTILVDSGYQHTGRGRELADQDTMTTTQRVVLSATAAPVSAGT